MGEEVIIREVKKRGNSIIINFDRDTIKFYKLKKGKFITIKILEVT